MFTHSRRTAAALILTTSVLTLLGAQGVAHAASPAGQAPLTAAQAKALSDNVSDKVIVVFKNQLRATPDNAAHRGARAAAAAAIQAPVVNELSVTHARNVKHFQLVNAVAATVSPGEAARLRADPAVAEVVRDEPIPVEGSLPTVPQAARAKAAGPKPLPGACTVAPKVQLNPQAVIDIHAATQSGTGPSAQGLGYTGAGVKVAYIADGLDPNNPDFIRANGQHVFVDFQDFSGTGSKAPTGGGEAFLDASSIAAQGLHTYNIQNYAAGFSRPCLIRILGVAPGASLVGLNVFGSSNQAFNSVFLEAINYAVNVDHVNVLNESFGSNPFPDTASLDLTKMADEAAVAAGVTVTASTGDSGITNTIGSPATDPAVISAGASTTLRAYAQSEIAGINLKGVTGWLNDNISAGSSAGFDQSGRTVDVVAPGDLNWALCTPKPKLFANCTDFFGRPASVQLTGGTSESSPLTAGVAALVIQAYAQAHGGVDPTPAVVKQIITSTATDIDAPGEQQGAGLLNAYQAVLAARSFPGGTQSAKGHAVLTGDSQLNAVDQPGTIEHLAETVTNDGQGPVTLGVSSRTLTPYTSVAHGTVNISDATGDAALVPFTVPAGEARLSSSIAYQAPGGPTDFNARLDLSLFTPSGQLAIFSLPQGAGNFGNVQVADPQPGTWLALIFGPPSSEGGTTGPVQFDAGVAQWTSFGSLSSSSLTLAPGASQSVTLTVPTPSQPGDQAGSLVFTSNASQPAFAAVTTVPVTLRSLVPTPDPTSTFTGTLTGGNGRAPSTGQTAYYQVVVPPGEPALNADVSTPDPANTFLAELVDPATGEAASTAANSLAGTGVNGGQVLTPQLGAQLHVPDPDPGTWTLIIDFYGQVSGTATSQPFTVSLDTTPVAAKATGLPDSAGTKLAAGTPVTVKVRVTNDGVAPEAYFIDGRLDQTTQLSLAAEDGSAVTVPITGTPPLYIVPSHTTALTAAATSTAPIFFDYFWNFGDPDLISSSPPLSSSPSGSFSSSAVVDGQWGITPFQVGPDGPHGLPPVTVQTSLTATANAFDPAVTSGTGDLWLGSVNPDNSINPVVVLPGQTVTIPVTITPSGPSGSTVSGTLYVADASIISGEASEDGFPGASPQGSDVAAFSYSYTIK